MERKIYRAIDTTNRVVIVHYFADDCIVCPYKELKLPSLIKKDCYQDNQNFLEGDT